ncbi:flagellar hook-associated protein 3 FlgL [Granulicella aggregans]|uniref:Flagellar hook-associated protein 3 FlgL n=1 Tax=Granulicella aggregans TaxID=474949 RepID=A0A7W7ZK46_9BACT|nr:flagellar hook-associated protein FlgL [Granulicella aggregans]MBB5061410.1 flagellar hook-associated protein 3 FlgL [Granulicella aggregans]
MSNLSIANSISSYIQQSEQALQTAISQASTGIRVSTPSDDPASAAALVGLQAAAATVDQYTSNTQTSLSQVQLADSVVTSVVSLLNRAITLGTEGANSTNSSVDRQSIAADVNGILTSVVSLANTTFQGQSLFGGTASGTTAFTADATSSTGYTYNGNSNINKISVGDTLTVQVNIPGSTLFDNPSASVLGALSNLAKALASGTSADIGSATNDISSALTAVSQQHAVYGSASNQLTSQESFLAQETVSFTSRETSIVGIDAATAIENLNQAQTSNSTVLAAAAKVSQQKTLLDYLN